MAETSIILLDKDAEEIVERLLLYGCSLVPDIKYDVPKYEAITSLNEYLYYRNKTNKFFVLHPDWQKEGLMIKGFMHKELGKKYFISQNKGGPTLDFFYVKEFVEDNSHFVGTGEIAYYPKHWTLSMNDYVEAPQTLRAFYKNITGKFKKNAVRVNTKKRTYWISKGAYEKLKSKEMSCIWESLPI